jgi:putative transposase
MTKALLAGIEDTGPNPTDRTKQGIKRSLLTDAAGVLSTANEVSAIRAK